jgi:glycosyltransferase involved in cell wall biosynthesis
MRIAYIAPYQGPAVVKRRPIVRNLSLAGQVKIRLIAELLRQKSHNVEVISQGEVIEHQLKYYPGFCESDPFNAKIRVYYSSALPVKFLNGLWSSLSALQIFKARHRISPFDIVLIYNLKIPQVICANYAIHRLRLPVVLEYEDGALVDRTGKPNHGLRSRFYRYTVKKLLNCISGCIAVSPLLLSQTRSSIPKLLLRGVIGDEIVNASKQENSPRKNRIVFSGTHYRTVGLEQLIRAWGTVNLPEWELHIAGLGKMTSTLQKLAQGDKSIVFHGQINREENARLLCSSKIGINPHDVSQAPGNVFPVKIIEYLAAGAHVITTPIGSLEKDLEAGITYMSDNTPAIIAATLQQVVRDRTYERTAGQAALQTYGPQAVSRSLDKLLNKVMAANSRDQRFGKGNRSVGRSKVETQRSGQSDFSMNAENPHTLSSRVITNDMSAACLIEAEKDRFRRLESQF